MDEAELQPSPVAALIELTRTRTGVSVREAARRSGLSEGRWRQIAKGYQSAAGGMKVPVNAPDDTLARMAESMGLQASDFHNIGEAGFADWFAGRQVSRLRHPSASRLEGDQYITRSVALIPDEVLVGELSRRLKLRSERLNEQGRDVRNDAEQRSSAATSRAPGSGVDDDEGVGEESLPVEQEAGSDS